MEKAFVKKVLAILLGVSLVILVYETVSLIVAVALFDDLQIFENSLNDLEAFIKWSAVALACMLIPALASYVFAFFGKNKLFVLISAALSLIVTICCIAFFCMARVYAMQGFSSSSYAQGASFLSEFIQIAIASALIGAYLLVAFLRSVKKKHTETVEVTVAAEVSENEEA